MFPLRQAPAALGVEVAQAAGSYPDGVRPVVPGDVLRLEVVPLRKGGAIWKMRGEAKVDGQVVCEGEFLATMGKAG